MSDPPHSHKQWCHPTLAGSYDTSEIIDLLEQSDHTEIHVGSDSHKRKGHPGEWLFANVICLYTPGKSGSGTYFYRRVVVKKNYRLDLYSRIMEEANQSIDLACSVAAIITSKKIYVHADTNTDDRYPTAKFTNTIKNWVLSCGFNFLCKPDSWASSGVADRHAK